MSIVYDLEYCRRCRKPHISKSYSRTNYCTTCANEIAVNKSAFNRWASSNIFIELSFIDCIDSNNWPGFIDIKYDSNIINKIILKFPKVKFHQSIYQIKDFLNVEDRRFLYLISDNQKELLKIGQTSNIIGRFNKYYNLSKNKPLKYDIFYVESFEEQDLYENKIRNYLEYLGYLLPKDNSNFRLKYIKG